MTLYRWDLPDALERAGGWPARDTAERFGSKRFGIVHVDHATQQRRIKDSGRWYAALIGRRPPGAGRR